MTKVTMNETPPSAELIAKASPEAAVTDARGRVFTLKKPGVLSQYRLVDLLGDSAKNEVYMAMVLPLTYVSAIDGDPSAQPNTRLQLDALIQRLDEDGIAAIMAGVEKHFGTSDPEKDKASLKN